MVLDLKEGAELKAKLKALEQEHKEALRMLHEGFKSRLAAICPKALKK